MKQTSLRTEFVEFIPKRLDDGVIYVSQRYKTALHLCCCGCGEEVVTPLGPADWSLRVVRGAVTLHPSIGNWSLACRSHYWIRNGQVLWAASMTQAEIIWGRQHDREMREILQSKRDTIQETTPSEPGDPLTGARNPSWRHLINRALRKLLRR